MMKPATLSPAELKSRIPDVATVARDLYGVQFQRGIARCLFPGKHNNGDQDPSLKHDRNKERLFCASQSCLGADGVDAIGLVELIQRCSFGEAMQKLADHYGIQRGDTHQTLARHNGTIRSKDHSRRPILASTVRKSMAARGFTGVAEFDYGTNLRTVSFDHESERQSDKDRPVKEFRWEHQVEGVWYSGDGRLPKPLYVNREFRDRDHAILVVGFEGEAKADLAGDFDLPAFSFKNITQEQAQMLVDCDVILWPDNDQTGEEQAAAAAQTITDAGMARSLRLLRPPADFPKAADIIDVVNDLKWDGARISQLLETATPAASGISARIAPFGKANDASDGASGIGRGTAPGKNWPEPLRGEAFHGVGGELVRLIEPHSEADPAALLVQFLVAFGNLIGRHAHFTAEADKHFTNLFAVLVGQTAKGRKGTSLGQVQSILTQIDSGWVDTRNMGGLASGEGLIWAVRDEIREKSPFRDKGRVTGYEDVVTDAGEDDKWLMVVESEFARVLQASEREANTLSAIVRQAWDNGNLRILTKNKAARATEAHISIIGHITKDELRRLLSNIAAGNGFANRFLWVCTRRSKLLPEGGALGEVNFAPILRTIQRATDYARTAGKMNRDNPAKALWALAYEELSDGKLGLLGAVTSRAESQVMRIACVYALLDCSSEVSTEHLRAALAVWQYCMDSAAFIFGDALGDPTADAIMTELRTRSQGMTRNEIRDFFGRNKSSSEIERALCLLQEHGLARVEREREQQGQIRRTERWFGITTVRG